MSFALQDQPLNSVCVDRLIPLRPGQLPANASSHRINRYLFQTGLISMHMLPPFTSKAKMNHIHSGDPRINTKLNTTIQSNNTSDWDHDSPRILKMYL